MPTIWCFVDCEKGKLLGKGWRCIMAKFCVFLQRASPWLAEQCRKRALLMWKVPECVMTDGATDGLSKMAAWLQSVHRGIVLCLMSGEWMGTWEERGKPAYSRGHGGMSRKWAPSKSGRSILWWKDESWTGNFGCVEVLGRSKLWCFVYHNLQKALRGLDWRYWTSSRAKQQNSQWC